MKIRATIHNAKVQNKYTWEKSYIIIRNREEIVLKTETNLSTNGKTIHEKIRHSFLISL